MATSAMTKAKAAAAGDASKKPVMVRPWPIGTIPVERSIYDQTVTMTSGTVDFPRYEVQALGYLRRMTLKVTCNIADNSADVAYNADAPFNVLQSLAFYDTDSKPLFGPLSGYNAFIENLLGAHRENGDQRASNFYSAATGTGGTGGSFSFMLSIPVEWNKRSGLGSLPNKNNSASFTVEARLNASTAVYSTPPSNLGSVRLQIIDEDWLDPFPTDTDGNPVQQTPPANNSTLFTQVQRYVMASGEFNQKLRPFQTGFLRNLIFVVRDENGSRQTGDGEWPERFRITYENNEILNRDRDFWRHLLAEDFNLAGTVETAGGRPYGVYPYYLTWDFGLKPGVEQGRLYLPVSDATSINIEGTLSGSGGNTIDVITQVINPVGGAKAITAGNL